VDDVIAAESLRRRRGVELLEAEAARARAELANIDWQDDFRLRVDEDPEAEL
jgi:hypothetical protein